MRADGSPRYLANDEEREEAGSPDTLGAVRGALALLLARAVGWGAIAAREGAMASVARATWAAHPCLRVVGGSDRGDPRTPVVSLVVAAAAAGAPGGQLQLHWGFVTAVLNDVFGVQARGGCLCAGPLVQALLGWGGGGGGELAALERALLAKDELLRPGVVRLSFPFYMSHAAFRYTLAAVRWVASHGTALLALYQPLAESGEWRVNRSAVVAALAEGYRVAPPRAIGVGGGGADAAAAAAAALSPRDVIAAATSGPGVGGEHALAAAKGSFHAHPRRWLQSLAFGGGGGASWPSRRMLVTCADDDDEAAAAAAADAAAARAPTAAAAVSEAALYRAYLAEADVLLAGLAAAAGGVAGGAGSAAVPAAAAGVAPQHAPASLLSPAGLGLRWFALTGDLVVAGSRSGSGGGGEAAGEEPPHARTAPTTDYVGRVSTWAPPPAPQPQPPPPAAPPATRAGGYWLAPPPHLVALLDSEAPTPSQLRQWDGAAEAVLVAGAGGSGGGGGAADGWAAATAGRAPERPRQQQQQQRKPQHDHQRQQQLQQARRAASGLKRSAAVAAAGDGTGSGAAAAAASGGSTPASAADAVMAGGSSSSGGGGGGWQHDDGDLQPRPHKRAHADAAAAPAEAAAASAAAAAAADDDPGGRAPAAAAAGSASASASGGAQPPPPFQVSAARRDPARAAALRATLAAIARLPKPPPALARSLHKALGRGIKEFAMIAEGDRVLVGLSGGKDSMSLLILLAGLRARAPVAFDLAAATVDPQYPGFDPSPLKAFCAGLGIPYFYESQPVIAAAAAHMTNDSICAWCSRMKRGILYSTMRRERYNVLALGQHLDDFAESWLMSAFRNGLLRTMKAHYTVDAGDLRVIRPLVFARERATREFAAACSLPVISEQ